MFVGSRAEIQKTSKCNDSGRNHACIEGADGIAESGAILRVQRPGSIVVKDRFFEQSVVKHVDHFPIPTDPSYPQGCPDIFPGNELHGFAVPGEGNGAPFRGLAAIALRLAFVDNAFGTEKISESHWCEALMMASDAQPSRAKQQAKCQRMRSCDFLLRYVMVVYATGR